MSKNANDCPANSCTVSNTGWDFLAKGLTKVGVTRSLLITLALLPFAWNGVTLVANGFAHLWRVATTAVGTP